MGDLAGWVAGWLRRSVGSVGVRPPKSTSAMEKGWIRLSEVLGEGLSVVRGRLRVMS